MMTGIGMAISDLSGSPLTDFLIPGLILFVVLGLHLFVVAWGVEVPNRAITVAHVNEW